MTWPRNKTRVVKNKTGLVPLISLSRRSISIYHPLVAHSFKGKRYALSSYLHPPSLIHFRLPLCFRFCFRRDSHALLAEERVCIYAPRFYSAARESRDLKFLLFMKAPTYVVAERIRGEGWKGVSTHAEKPFREIRIARRGTKPLSSRTFSYSPMGNTPSFRFPALELLVELHPGEKVVLHADSFSCCRAGNVLRRGNRGVIERQEIPRVHSERRRERSRSGAMLFGSNHKPIPSC